MIWQQYTTDLGRVYPFLSLSVQQVNDVTTSVNPLNLLPPTDLDRLIERNNACAVSGLTPRQIKIYTTDGAQFKLNYYRPFNQVLEDYLVNHLAIVAYEWIGEKVRYGRLKRMLENV